MPLESIEQFLDDARLDQGLAEAPNGGGVRGLVAVFQTDEAAEGGALVDDVLGIFVEHAVEGLEDENPEHEQGLERFASCCGFPLFVERVFDGGQKDIPVDDAVQAGQWIAFFVSSFEDDLLVEESWL